MRCQAECRNNAIDYVSDKDGTVVALCPQHTKEALLIYHGAKVVGTVGLPVSDDKFLSGVLMLEEQWTKVS